ncbi:MAG: GNAT family N-acetyltransferase, partial [Methanomassiliicoccaceae archaeon]|nr:GNAT family N-acetyltransferase [Methanomassiliicoccaceae archaeon]
CAWSGNEIIGFLAATICENYLYSGKYLYVSTLVVDEKQRGKHIGTLLLDTAIGKAKQKGCRAVDLDSSFFRTASHEFYEHYGFRKRAFNFTMKI